LLDRPDLHVGVVDSYARYCIGPGQPRLPSKCFPDSSGLVRMSIPPGRVAPSALKADSLFPVLTAPVLLARYRLSPELPPAAFWGSLGASAPLCRDRGRAGGYRLLCKTRTTKNPTAATVNKAVDASDFPRARAMTARLNAAIAPSCRERMSLNTIPQTSYATRTGAAVRPPECRPLPVSLASMCLVGAYSLLIRQPNSSGPS
jgi:hypothetical protein